MIKMGFTATRYGMSPAQQGQLEVILDYFEIDEFHHGDCEGGDEEAHRIIVQKFYHNPKIQIVIHPPTDHTHRAYCNKKYPYPNTVIYPPQPYLQRNRMIVRTTNILCAGPQEMKEKVRSGTWSTVRYGRDAKHPIIMLTP